MGKKKKKWSLLLVIAIKSELQTYLVEMNAKELVSLINSQRILKKLIQSKCD